MNGEEMEGRRKEGTFRSGSTLGRKFLFSALRTTLFFFDAYSDLTACFECQIRCSYDNTKLNEWKEKGETEEDFFN